MYNNDLKTKNNKQFHNFFAVKSDIWGILNSLLFIQSYFKVDGLYYSLESAECKVTSSFMWINEYNEYNFNFVPCYRKPEYFVL